MEKLRKTFLAVPFVVSQSRISCGILILLYPIYENIGIFPALHQQWLEFPVAKLVFTQLVLCVLMNIQRISNHVHMIRRGRVTWLLSCYPLLT